MTESQFKKLAEQFALGLQLRAADLQQEILELEATLAQRRATLQAASLTTERAANFRVKVGADFQCPRCWVERGVSAKVRPTGHGTRFQDTWRCEACDYRFATEA